MAVDNTSGRKCAPSELPAEAKTLSWGAFFWGPIWGIVNSTWIALLCVIFPFVVNIILLFKGRQWAWENKRWDDAAQFAKSERAWAIWGLILVMFPFFVVAILVGLGSGFAILGREQPAEIGRPKWKAGDSVDVEVTLVRNDRRELACASAEEVGGKHCLFEAPNKPWSKGGDPNDVLQPMTTTDRVQFTTAGLWSQPAVSPEKLPTTRFTLKCKYRVEGTLKSVAVRWEETGTWYPQERWYAGAVSDCKVAQ